MRLPNLIIGIIIVLIGIFFIANTLDFPDLTLEPVGPAFMPRLYSILLIFLGSILIIKALREKAENKETESNMKYALISMLIVVVYVLIIPLLGFYISTFIFSLTFLFFSQVRNKIILVSIPVGAILFIFIFFDKILKVAIPVGSLFS